MYAFGLVLRELAGVVQDSPDWLVRVANKLTDPDPGKRPTASGSLRYELSPDWQIQGLMIGGGWKPEAHPEFTGRQAVFDAFDAFRARDTVRERGVYS